jgi:hypothetical protein
MGETQNRNSASAAEHESRELAPDYASGLVAVADGEPGDGSIVSVKVV